MILIFGDTHGKFNHVKRTVATHKPAAIIFLGDVEVSKPFHEELEEILDLTDVWWIPGNHDTDSRATYDNLFGSELADRNLHGRVVTIDGVRVAGLGGIFREKIWFPDPDDAMPVYDSFDEFENNIRRELAYHQISEAKAKGELLTHRSSIFFEDWYALYGHAADVLVTHEAPTCHPKGYAKIDELAQSMGVQVTFHGHHHDRLDYSADADRLGFNAHAVGLRGICDITGQPILAGELDHKRQRKL